MEVGSLAPTLGKFSMCNPETTGPCFSAQTQPITFLQCSRRLGLHRRALQASAVNVATVVGFSCPLVQLPSTNGAGIAEKRRSRQLSPGKGLVVLLLVVSTPLLDSRTASVCPVFHVYFPLSTVAVCSTTDVVLFIFYHSLHPEPTGSTPLVFPQWMDDLISACPFLFFFKSCRSYDVR